MPAIRITIVTDQHGDKVKEARIALSRLLPQVAKLLSAGEYVGNFRVIDPETQQVYYGDVDEL